jgi:hypothetical protein
VKSCWNQESAIYPPPYWILYIANSVFQTKQVLPKKQHLLGSMKDSRTTDLRLGLLVISDQDDKLKPTMKISNLCVWQNILPLVRRGLMPHSKVHRLILGNVGSKVVNPMWSWGYVSIKVIIPRLWSPSPHLKFNSLEQFNFHRWALVGPLMSQGSL